MRLYIQDGIFQSITDDQGVPRHLFAYALSRLALAFHPRARSALVLGLAAGSVPTHLKKAGLTVEAVDINPDALLIAQRYFGFDPNTAKVHVADARTFVRRCGHSYDIVVVDLFHGDFVPDYLLTEEFFKDVSGCLTPEGTVVFNVWVHHNYEALLGHILATMSSSFPRLFVFRAPSEEATQNTFIVGARGDVPENLSVNVENAPDGLRDQLAALARNGREVTGQELAAGTVFTDDYNAFLAESASEYLAFRSLALRALPPNFFVN